MCKKGFLKSLFYAWNAWVLYAEIIWLKLGGINGSLKMMMTFASRQTGNDITRVTSATSRTEQILFLRLMWFIVFMMLTTLDWMASRVHIQTWLLTIEFSRLEHTCVGKGWLFEFSLTWEQTFGWRVPFLLLFPFSSNIVAQFFSFPEAVDYGVSENQNV